MNKNVPSNYKTHVFLSYKALTDDIPGAEIFNKWLKFFKDELSSKLIFELPKSDHIIYDFARDVPHNVNNYPDNLRKELACSKVLVPLFSTGYFESVWCQKEFLFMKERERLLGLNSDSMGLIMPILIGDGNHFPEIVKQMQILDLSKYIHHPIYFAEGKSYKDFKDKLVPWAKTLVKVIENIPPWQADWLNKELVSDEELQGVFSKNNISAPIRMA